MSIWVQPLSKDKAKERLLIGAIEKIYNDVHVNGEDGIGPSIYDILLSFGLVDKNGNLTHKTKKGNTK